MEKLPTSSEEKSKYRGVQHWLFVWELKALLETLNDGDDLTPNAVANLAIGRKEEYIGFIDFATGEVELDDKICF